MIYPKDIQRRFIDYLYYGYIPPKKYPAWIYALPEYQIFEQKCQLSIASDLFNKNIDKILGYLNSKNRVIIPISGGWDSRYILGSVLKKIPTGQIITYTFGVPGQLDYDIGKLISSHAGVKHVEIDLSTVVPNWNNLLQSVKKSPWTKVFDAFYNQTSVKLVADEGDILVSGFMGDPLTGGHIIQSQKKKEIVKEFVRKQNITNNPSILPSDYNPVDSIPEIPGSGSYRFSELMDVGIRQMYMIAPIVTANKEIINWGIDLGCSEDGVQYYSPFSDPEWVLFWFNAPLEQKIKRKLFFDMMKKDIPELFQLPAKDYFGAAKNIGIGYHLKKYKIRVSQKLNQINPRLFSSSIRMLNYIDFGQAFRTSEHFKAILEKSIELLEKNSITPWIDFNKMKKEHNVLYIDHSKSFLVFIGLALNMESGQ